MLVPSMAWWQILDTVLPGRYPNRVGWAVYNTYSPEPGGTTLEEIAVQHGLW
jgi:hypothetical protein